MKATPSHYALKMAKKDVDIDDSVFQKRARILAKKLGKDEKEFIRQQTGILAREVARFTPPFASFPKLTNSASVGTSKDMQAGKWAMFIDIAQICTVKEKGVITKAKKSWGSGPIIYGKGKVIAKGIIDDAGSLHAWHNANQGANNRTKPLSGSNRYWVSAPVFKKYVKDQQANVGTAKAAFYKAAMALGAKVTAPALVKKNIMNSVGTGTVKKESKGSKGTITGRAGGLFHTNRHLPMLRKNRLIKAVKRGEFLMRKAAKDSSFKVV